MRLGVLGSGKGSNFVAVQRAILDGRLPAEVAVVVSDRAEAGILDHARAFGLPAEALPPSRFKTKLEPELEEALVALLRRYEVEWVVLAGYMRVVKEPLLRAFPKRIVNIHPSLLPAFKGLEAWKQALAAGVPEAGCTVHEVNAEIDGGAILGQERVPVLPGDTAETLHARIQEAEHRLYPAVLAQLAAAS
ncbi:MAG: phosphoribosylglycinamide formyltransferase [Verrucomicrobium sp.]|nr:phosphoribosylglycinamide formyltransferase [Verrucomicrobium sp.]